MSAIEGADEAVGRCFVPGGLSALLVSSHPGWLCPPRCERRFQGLGGPAQAGVLAEHGGGGQSAETSATPPVSSAAPGFITKNAFSGGAYSQGNFMASTAPSNRGTTGDRVFYCTFQPVPSSAPESLIERGNLETA